MASKPERTIPPTEELFGGEFQTKLGMEISALVRDNYASRYTYHSYGATNIVSCTLIANPKPVLDPEQPKGMIILGHFDDYNSIESTLESAVYTILGEEPYGRQFVPIKGNLDYFNDPKRVSKINRIFSRGGKQRPESEEEYFKLLAEKLKAY